jgi:hypothetical protein
MDYQPADIFACYGTDATSRTISWGTASLVAPAGLRVGPSHVGIICWRQGAPLLVESTTQCDHPCVVQGLHARGVQAHYPEDRIRDYEQIGGKVEVYRLVDIDRLSVAESMLLTDILMKHFVGRGTGYNRRGAIMSGTRVLKRTSLLPSNDVQESVFCSQLVAKVLMRLHRLNRTNPARFHPAGLLRRLVHEGTYRRVSA